MVTVNNEYEQLSEDWRNRDRITWGLLGVIVIVGGLLLVGIYGSNGSNDTEVQKQVKETLSWAGFSFALLCTIMLLRNLYLQAVGADLMACIKGEGEQVKEALDYAGRVPIRRDSIGFCNLIQNIFKTISSFLLILLCASTAGLFIYLYYGFNGWWFVYAGLFCIVIAFVVTYIADVWSKCRHKRQMKPERRSIMWQNAAFILIGIGILILTGWGVKGFFMDSEIPLLIRIAVGAIGGGVLVLIGIAIKDRLSKAKKEDFKEVEK